MIGPATPLKILDGHMRLLIAETAREVLERQLAVFGAQRVIFGSDSRHAAEGYQHWLLSGQRSILDALQVSEEDHGRVLGGEHGTPARAAMVSRDRRRLPAAEGARAERSRHPEA